MNFERSSTSSRFVRRFATLQQQKRIEIQPRMQGFVNPVELLLDLCVLSLIIDNSSLCSLAMDAIPCVLKERRENKR
jgi:hypothetical protein